MNPHYPAVAARSGFRCEYCMAPERAFNFAFDVDHIVPRSRGGPDTDHNCALACMSCNVFKAASTVGPDGESGDAAPLFDPRTQRWGEHFNVNLITWHVEGVTSTGRATVAILRLNFDSQLQAREQRARLGLFPPEQR